MRKQEWKELWRVELPLEFKGKVISSRASENFFAFMTKEATQREDQFFVYIYDML